jgi:hypothetical protein
MITGALQVAASNDKSCLVETAGPDFYFDIFPGNYFTQCQPTNLTWDTQKPHIGNLTFHGMVLGGDMFALGPVPQSYIWDVNVRAGTSVMMIAGDS